MAAQRKRGFSINTDKLKFIEQRMREKGIDSHEALAEAARLSSDVIGKLFRSENIDKSSVEAITKALDIQPTEIVESDRWYRKTKKATSEAESTDYWQQVCRKMLDHQKKLSTLPIASEAMQFDLLNDGIFVSLALLERREPEHLHPNLHPARPIERFEEKPPIQYEQFLEQVLLQETGDRIAIVGEPGAGKTTLLQNIAFWILDKELGLPIWISVGDSIKNGDLERLKTYLTETWLEDAIPNVTQNVISGFWKQLEEQPIWFLLDGADEVVSSSGLTLDDIGKQIQGWLSQSRIILTCRLNVWDSEINALRDFQTYRTKEFDYPTQVEKFIENGFRKTNPQSGECLKTELTHPERARLQQLVRNPLRLMMLCTTWHEHQTLPETKAGLYERFTQEFYKWNKIKWKKKFSNYTFFPSTETKQELLNKALGRLACRALDEETSPFRLSHALVRDELGDSEEGSNLWLALHLGWLKVARNAEKRSERVYVFFHPTFQEYFAALAIDEDKWDFFLPCEHVDKPVQGKVYRVFKAHWKEVIKLWFGKQFSSDKDLREKAFDQLTNFQDNCSGFYSFQTYFLAAEVLEDFRILTEVKSQKIKDQIIRYAFGDFDGGRIQKTYQKPILIRARKIVKENFKVEDTQAVLLSLINNCYDEKVRWDIANTLHKLGITNGEIESIYTSGVRVKLEPHMVDILQKMTNVIQENNNTFDSKSKLNEEEREKFNELLANDITFEHLINLIQCSDDWFIVAIAADNLINNLRNGSAKTSQIIAAIQSIKPYFDTTTEETIHKQPKEYFRYRYVYEFLWCCAEKMKYPDFYEAWNAPSPIDTEPLQAVEK